MYGNFRIYKCPGLNYINSEVTVLILPTYHSIPNWTKFLIYKQMVHVIMGFILHTSGKSFFKQISNFELPDESCGESLPRFIDINGIFNEIPLPRRMRVIGILFFLRSN